MRRSSIGGTSTARAFFLLFSLGLAGAHAASPSPATREKVPEQSTAVKNVLVPVPAEIFSTLDRFADSNWVRVQRLEVTRWRPRVDQAETALLLGATIAEGFIAVEARDALTVQNVGRAVLKMARGLGVERAALRRSRSIVDHAERQDWPAVRREWDGVLPDVQQGMKELRSEQLAQLVSLGGWVRGAEALSALVLQNFSTENAEFLRQLTLLDYFEKNLGEMDEEIQTNPAVQRIRAAIKKVRPQLAEEEGPLTREMVKEISVIARDLMKSLARRAG